MTEHVRVTPLANDDRDVATIVGGELTATVTSVDQAATLPTDTQTATDSVDVDVDAIVDDLNLAAGGRHGQRERQWQTPDRCRYLGYGFGGQ